MWDALRTCHRGSSPACRVKKDFKEMTFKLRLKGYTVSTVTIDNKYLFRIYNLGGMSMHMYLQKKTAAGGTML